MAQEWREHRARLAQLQGKERQFRVQSERTKAELSQMREAIAKERAEIEEGRKAAASYQATLAQAKRDPIAFLQAAGLSYEDVTQYVLNGGIGDPARAVRFELEEWRKAQAAEKKAEEERRAAAEKQAQAQRQQSEGERLRQWQQNVIGFVRAKPEDYELIHLQGAFDLVPQVIYEHYRQTEAAGTPVMLTEKEAADKVEKWLFDSIEKATKTAKKFQPPKKDPPPAAPAPSGETAPPEPKPQPAAPAQPRTISELAAAVPSVPSVASDDRIARAAAAMERAFGRTG